MGSGAAPENMVSTLGSPESLTLASRLISRATGGTRVRALHCYKGSGAKVKVTNFSFMKIINFKFHRIKVKLQYNLLVGNTRLIPDCEDPLMDKHGQRSEGQ